MFVENSGFYFEITSSTNELIQSAKLNGLPSLDEFGSKAIYQQGSYYNWVFYQAKNPSPLDISIIDDSNEIVLLFYGSLYSKINPHSIIKLFKQANSADDISSILRQLSGVFSGVAHYKKEKKTYAFIDQFGVKKLFWGEINNDLIFTSHLKLISFYRGVSDLSNFSFGSILLTGQVFYGSVFEKINQVSAACIVEHQKKYLSEFEYTIYPVPKNISLKESIHLIKEAHLNFWDRLNSMGINDITLLLSRGKDARVLLKYILDSNITPNLLSFYRKNNKIDPFACFLLETTDDFQVASTLGKLIGLPVHELNTPNHYLLENLDQIVSLNHGTPLHWEFLAAAAKASEFSPFTVTGFVGDALAGKSHHYYTFSKINSSLDYAKLEFGHSGSILTYKAIAPILNSSEIAYLPTTDELFHKWNHQYSLCQSDDINMIYQQGLFRTRVLGRTGPTFDQMRLYTKPIYPYNDNEVINAYRSIPEKHLIWEKAHLAQLTSDSRFNSINTTRLKVSPVMELKLLPAIGLLRRLDRLKRRYNTKSITQSPSWDSVLKKALLNLGIDPITWDHIDMLPRTPGFYSTVANLISTLRIKKSLSQTLPLTYALEIKTWKKFNEK